MAQDVERTFLGEGPRRALQTVLRALALEFQSYAQAMSYVCGFLMFAHPPAGRQPAGHTAIQTPAPFMNPQGGP